MSLGMTSQAGGSGSASRVDRRSRSGFQPRVVSDIFEILAGSGEQSSKFWLALQEASTSRVVRRSASNVREKAWNSSEAVAQFSNHLQWLLSSDFSREDCRQIRYVVEAFHHLEPMIAILALAGLKIVRGEVGSPTLKLFRGSQSSSEPVFVGPVKFVEEEQEMAVLEPVVASYGRPVHALFRALALWPEYLQRFWTEFEEISESEKYLEKTREVCSVVETSADSIASSGVVDMPAKLSSEAEETVQHYVAVSCDVMIAVNALRRMFIDAEISARETE